MPSSPRFGSSAGHSCALFRLAFATAPPIVRVNLATDTNSLAHYAKGTQSGISLSSIALLPLVGTGFQNLFHSPQRGSFHLSLAVLCAIGDMLYLVLDDGPPGFPQGFSSPVVLGILLELQSISSTGLSPSLAALPRAFRYRFWSHIGVPQPHKSKLSWFRLSPVRSPLLGGSLA